jgi:hypothetical protein
MMAESAKTSVVEYGTSGFAFQILRATFVKNDFISSDAEFEERST